MTQRRRQIGATRDPLLEAVRSAARQEQFLEVVSAEEAQARFARHLDGLMHETR